MTTTVFENGTQDFAVAATFKIAATSLASFKVYQDTGYPNLPSVWKLIKTTADNETYTSSAFSTATRLRIEAGHADVFYDLGTSPSIATPVAAISGSADPFPLAGVGDTQGGAISVTGGTSSTSANAGGAASLAGGEPGATGVGGASSVTGGDGGATSGAGGAASVTGGAGTLGDSAGGVASVTGGAGSATNAAGGAVSATGGAGAGTGNGGAASSTGGVAGATGVGGAASVVGGAGGATSGAGGAASLTGGDGSLGDSVGGAASITGGAGSATNADGGSIVLTPGAKAGTGIAGVIRNVGIASKQQDAPSTATTAATFTGAQLIAGILVGTHPGTGNVNMAFPAGSVLDAVLPASFSAEDSIDITIVNVSSAAADTYTVTAGSQFTIVGQPLIYGVHAAVFGSGSATFRLRKTATDTFVAYRIA